MKHQSIKLFVAALTIALCACSSPMKTTDQVKHTMFLPPALADDWSQWLIGAWQGSGGSQAGSGRGIERIEFALNGQFLFCRGEGDITEITPDQTAYLKKNMHASEEEIERFRTSPYRSLEIFTIDQTTGEAIGYSFDSLRCIATGRGRREGNRQLMDWEWTNGHKSTRITERVSDDRMAITQCTPMPDGRIMEEKGEATRCAATDAAKTAPDSREVTAVKAFIAAINAHDVAALSALMPEDHTFVDSGGTTIMGREKILTAWRQYFAMFPDYRVRADSILQNDSVVAVFGTWSATYAGKRGLQSENALSSPAAWTAAVRDGKIRAWQVYTDHTRTAEVVKRTEE